MKDEREKTNSTPPAPQEIKSSDIPNAHAAGDGAMGRNDEKIEEGETGDNKKSSKENEITSY